jgi:hypothetical protein
MSRQQQKDLRSLDAQLNDELKLDDIEIQWTLDEVVLMQAHTF